MQEIKKESGGAILFSFSKPFGLHNIHFESHRKIGHKDNHIDLSTPFWRDKLFLCGSKWEVEIN